MTYSGLDKTNVSQHKLPFVFSGKGKKSVHARGSLIERKREFIRKKVQHPPKTSESRRIYDSNHVPEGRSSHSNLRRKTALMDAEENQLNNRCVKERDGRQRD